jgi:tetratricopeptide (TPR) repeat protein
MSRFFRKLLSLRNIILKPKTSPDFITEEQWSADFSKPKQARFVIKTESSYDAKLQRFGARHCLALGVKKNGCIAWTEAPEYRYRDQVINAAFRLDSHGGYAAAGIMFRMVDEKTYYSFLVSGKGYFRLDALRNGMPLPLIGWTELPGEAAMEIASEHAVDFTLIVHGAHIVILIRGHWAAELSDSSILEGIICFTAASYDVNKDTVDEGRPSALLFSPLPLAAVGPYTAEAFLESLTVESRISEVAALYEKWSESPEIHPKSRFALAETLTAMNQNSAALAQIRKAWETPGYKKMQKELLLAGRLALTLNLAKDAEEYISACFEENVDSPEGKEAITEMAKILYSGARYKELKDYCIEAVKIRGDDPVLRTFLGHAYWSLGENKKAAAAYDKAFDLDNKNGIPAKNAANVYEALGRKTEALERYLVSGKVFMNSGNYDDLGALVPRLLLLGADNRDAHALAGKWAFGVEDWKMAAEELDKAEKLEKKKRREKGDGSIPYLRALLLVREGKREEAAVLFKEAVSLEGNFALYRFKLAENRFLLTGDPDDKELCSNLDAAIALAPGDGWINNFAAQLCLKRGGLESASGYLENAARVLGEVPAIKVNRAELCRRRGEYDKALELLQKGGLDDPDGMLANCAGNILSAAGRFEEAGTHYIAALNKDPENIAYLTNRASCLIELERYGEADTILARIHDKEASPGVLELISYVASKKGEFFRAEAACRAALKMDPLHVPSLLSFCWILISLRKYAESEEVLKRLDSLTLSGADAARRGELRARLDSFLYETIPCGSCERSWKVLKDPPPSPALRLFAMPPDNLPAGSCPECGKTWCIGCAKKNIDESGRFICSGCGKALKLINQGLKQIIIEWAARDGLIQKKRGRPKGSKNKRTKFAPASAPQSFAPQPETQAVKRKRGRPPKKL